MCGPQKHSVGRVRSRVFSHTNHRTRNCQTRYGSGQRCQNQAASLTSSDSNSLEYLTCFHSQKLSLSHCALPHAGGTFCAPPPQCLRRSTWKIHPATSSAHSASCLSLNGN